MVSLPAVLMLAFLFQQEPQDPPPLPTAITLKPAKVATAAEVKQASEALYARCKEYGYKGVSTSVEDGDVRLECKTGITPAMIDTISVLGAFAAASVQIRFAAVLSDVEAEQYAPGQSSPEDCEWIRDPNPEWAKPEYRFVKRDKSFKAWWLVKKKPAFDMRKKWRTSKTLEKDLVSGIRWVRRVTGADTRKEVPNEWFFEFDRPTSKALYDQSKETLAVMSLFVDDCCFEYSDGDKYKSALYDPERTDGKARWMHYWSCNETFGIAINNPMAVPLKIQR